MKTIRKSILPLLLAVLCTLSLFGCSSSEASSSGSGSADASSVYVVSEGVYLDDIAWYSNNDTMLILNSDNTYELYYKRDVFGTTDPGIKGNKTVIYYGSYTSEASADGETSHLDVSLETPTRIYMSQSGKAWGYDSISGNVMLDTANWTDDMTTIAFPEGSDDGAQDFLDKYAQAMTITVEDPSLLAEDTTLSYRIVTLPDVELEITGD